MPKDNLENFDLSCPTPVTRHTRILLGHGSGGGMMHDLVNQITGLLSGRSVYASHDSAALEFSGKRLAFTTDSYVINPVFFPGGDIGSLAVYGTVNDLAMAGARPLYLSLGLILEEGLPMEDLEKILQSIKKAADESCVKVVTGDTKVVDKGKGDKIFINTSGIGVMEHDLEICPQEISPGDQIIINGDIARHGMAVMAVREGLEFESTIRSDTAPLADLVLKLIDAKIRVHCLRDLTRGGLASALNELVTASGWSAAIQESAVAVRQDVKAACELLGLDPLYVANEGRFIAYVHPEDAPRAVKIMKTHPLGADASLIGAVLDDNEGLVRMKSRMGTMRIVDMLAGDQLPRIC